jgi:hypothetical protein
MFRLYIRLRRETLGPVGLQTFSIRKLSNNRFLFKMNESKFQIRMNVMTQALVT